MIIISLNIQGVRKLSDNIRDVFLNPPEEYTPIPFWFWNDNLREEEITRQIEDFYQKGVNGFVIHPRIGIPKEIEYLSDSFMKYVTCAVQEAKKRDMKVILYDEAMYPSGSAHGMVVKNNPEYASKALKMTEYEVEGEFYKKLSEQEVEKVVSVQAVKKVSRQEILPESIKKVSVINNGISFKAEDSGNWSVLVFTETFTGGHIRGIHFGEDDGEEGAPASGDLLNKEAIQEFIKLTHERYYQVLKEYFGDTIIAMFTDEPCIMGRGDMTGLIPWTGGFLDYYIGKGNRELDLPLLWFEAGEKSNIAKRNYDETVNKRMEESYYKPISKWCEDHHIALTGHPESSDDIGFLKHFQIPGQDLVWRWVAPEDGLSLEGAHSTMGKCSSDSARHRGIKRNGNECFGCCGKDGVDWAFTADDMKWYMDWLFVRGVNLLLPHAFFYSIEGERRVGERPPDVGPNNIWWPHYKQISDYIKRMSYLMTDSVNQAQVAVLCGAHHLPWQIVKPLYENQIEFNYLENELFVSEDCLIQDACIEIAEYQYKVLLIEDRFLINKENKDKIQHFLDQGGQVFVYNPDNMELPVKGITLLHSLQETVSKIDEVLERDFYTVTQVRDLRISHIRKGKAEIYVLVNEGEGEIHTLATISTLGSLERWDAFKGTVEKADIIRKINGKSMELDLFIKRREAVILFVNTEELPEIVPTHEKDAKQLSTQQLMLLDNKWHMGKTMDSLEAIDSLLPWNEKSNLRNYSGSMVYKTVLQVDNPQGYKKVELNLGDVHEIAQVTFNNQEVGVQMWAPYTFDVTNAIKEGENILIVEVNNTVANRMCNLSRTSGLLGLVSMNISYK